MVSPVDRVLEAAREDPRVAGVLLYGSAARGEDREGSDVDLCVVLDPSHEEGASGGRRDGGEDEGASPSRVRLDLVTEAEVEPEEVDIQVFQGLPMYVRKRVLEEGEVLWTRDLDALYDVAIRFVRAWEDYRPIYEDYLEGVRAG